MPKITEEIKGVIFRLKSLNKTWLEISEASGLKINTIRLFYKRFKKIEGLPLREKLSKTAIKARLGHKIKRKVKEDPKISVRKLYKWAKDGHSYEGSKSSLHRFLQRNSYKSLVAKKR